VRVDRALAAGLAFSVALHLAVLVSWEREPEVPGKVPPKRMVARLIAGTGGREAAPSDAAAPEQEPARGDGAGIPVLSSFHAGFAGGGSPSSRPVKIRPLPGPGKKADTRAGGTAKKPLHSSARAAFAAPPAMRSAVPALPGDPLAEIRRRIETHKSYPGLARRKGWEGDVVVELQLDGGGGVRDVKVVEKSGHGILDRATLATIRKAGPYPPLPGRVRVPVSYRLAPE